MFGPAFFVAGVAAVVLLGLSKGGFAGVGALGTPLLALAIGPVKAAAVVLPILILQDAVGVWAFRRDWDRGIVATMLPGAVAGVALGWFYAARLPAAATAAMLGAISVLFAARSLWLRRGGRTPLPRHHGRAFGVAMGAASGLTSQIAHAGQPPFQIYVLPRRLPRDRLIGTTAVFFAALNWVKAPAYLALGQFTPRHLLASAALAPVALASTVAGVGLARQVDAERFYLLVYWLMLLVGVKLVWDGAHGQG